MRKSFGKALAVLIVIALVTAVTLYYSLGRKSVEKPAPTLTPTTITTTLTTTSTATETITKTITTTMLTRTTLITTTTVFVIERYTETMIKTVTVTVAPLDSDGDSIPDEKELEYGTDPYKPNYLFAYALKKLPEEETLKFRNVENFNISSISLVDLYTSLPQDKRNSKEVNELLKQILLDNTINELEKNLFDDKFVHPTQPTIINLSWVPTRTNLDKIYDIKITFVARDDKTPIAYAELHFKPVEYQYMIDKYGMKLEDYQKVFPPDSERVLILSPTDGRFNDLEEEFEVSITNIVGGREYKIVALVRDLAGNNRTIEVKTPYIRQFENLGKELYDKGIIVAATYYPLYPDPHPWDWLSVRTYPILGKYDVRDDIIISKHIDWATGHGINTFFVSWGIFEDEDLNMRAHQNTIKLINNQLAKQIHISILYELPHRLRAAGIQPAESGFIINEDDDLTKISNDFRIITDDIIKNSNFLYIEGRPVIYLYETKSVNGKIERLIEAINAPINKEIYTDAFLISDHATPIALPPYEEFLENALKYDGWTLWAGGYFRDRSYSLDYLENGLIGWRDISKNYSKLFIPSIIPGFTDPRDPKTIPYPRNIDNFKKAIELALQYSYTPYLKGKPKIIIRVDTFNEWGEDTGIEPTVSEQMSYLEALKEKLTSILVNLTTDKTPPSVTSLNWAPTRVVLDKVYDINVSFTAIDYENPIAYAELHFVPVEYYYMIEKYGMRPEDYPKVFPPDKERVLVLTPVDGKFDSLKEKFSVPIKDIVGGREYKIVALVRDLAGNEKITEVKTPYIRQFENIAKTDDINVVALYLLWWGKDNNWANYKGNVFPLLGKYSSKDTMVINKHVDWATGHGIDVFLINWAGQDYQDDALKNYFLEADLVKRGDIKFMILYESIHRLKNSNPGWNLFDLENVQILDSDLSYLSQNYFKHPSYFKINDRSVFYLYESKGIFGNVSQIGKLKEKFGLFIISDHAHPLANPNDTFPQNNPMAVRWGDVAKQFDALMPTAGLYDGFLWWRGYFNGAVVENPVDNNKWLEFKKLGNDKWLRFCNENSLVFIPSITTGISYRYAPWGNPEWPRIERNPQQLKERIEFELKYLDLKQKILFVSEFNNFFEEASLEPDTQNGLAYLVVLKDVLVSHSQHSLAQWLGGLLHI